MRFSQQTILITSIAILLNGCSIFSGDDETEFDPGDYTRAKMSEQLDVPPAIGRDNSQDLFIVPDLMPEAQSEVFGNNKEILAPMQILSLGSDIRTNRETQVASAFINAPEIQVWDMLNRFMINDGIAVTNRQVGDGILVTDWITRYQEVFWGSDEPVSRHRFRLKLLDAERPNETRLDVEVMAAENYTDDEGWEPYVDANRAGSEFMNQFLGFMYVQNIESSRERVSQSGLGGITVSLGSDPEGNPALVTSSDFEQTWSRVRIAMRLVKMRIDDRDRSQGLYFVSKIDDEDGFFESLAFWSDDDSDAMQIENGNYRVQVESAGERTYIVFTDTDDVPLKADILARNFNLLAKAFKARVKESELTDS